MDQLVVRLRRGDEAAFEEFASQYEQMVYRIALRQLGNAYDAQDAAQEVFLRVWRGIGRFREDARLSTWVYQITLNVCRDAQRRSARRPETSLVQTGEDGEEAELEVPDESFAPEALYERTELREELDAALKELTPEHRQIVLLREVTGLSYGEIGEVLELSEGTVKSRLFRARDKLAGILRGNGNKSSRRASNGAEDKRREVSV